MKKHSIAGADSKQGHFLEANEAPKEIMSGIYVIKEGGNSTSTNHKDIPFVKGLSTVQMVYDSAAKIRRQVID